MNRKVYFTKLNEEGKYKIGAGNPEERLKQYKTLYPDAMIIGIIECPNIKAEVMEQKIFGELNLYHYKQEIFNIPDPKIIDKIINFHKGYPMQEYVFNNKVRTKVTTFFDNLNKSYFRPSCAHYTHLPAMPMGKTQGSKPETYRSVYADEYGLPNLQPGDKAYHSRKWGRTRVYVSQKFWNERDIHRVKGGKIA